MEGVAQMMAMGGGMALGAIPLSFLALGYLFILIDRRDDRPGKDDKQVGSKLVLWVLILTGAVMALMGVHQILSFVLGGFKGGFAAIKDALVFLVVGAAVAAAFALVFLPRTNNGTHPQPERFAMGFLALLSGLAAIAAFYMLVHSLVFSSSWHDKAEALSALVVAGGTAFLSLFRHGQLSGWTVPVRPAAPMPPAGGGYPGQQGGYPGQQGGYPGQQGGYPGQQGGYPGQQGGYPGPQGGGGYPGGGQGGGYPGGGQGGYGR